MKKLTTKTRNIIITSTVCTLAMSAGIGLAVFFGENLFKKVSVKADSDWVAYEDDARSLLKRYDKANGNFDSFKGYELVNIAINNYEKTENHYSVLEGVASANSMGVNVDQTIKTTCIKNGENLFWESISESKFAAPAYRFYETSNENFISQYSGKVIKGVGGTQAEWDNASKQDIEFTEFENTWGKTLEISNIYTISSKTVTNPDEPVKKDENGNYVINLVLDPVNANRRYIRQMISMSKPNGDPVFESLNIKYILDGDLKIVEKQVEEKYNIVVGFSADTVTKMTEHFFYDVAIDIPDLNTNCTYGGK